MADDRVVLEYLIKAQDQARAILADNVKVMSGLESAIKNVGGASDKTNKETVPLVVTMQELKGAIDQTFGRLMNYVKGATMAAAEAQMMGTALRVAGTNAGYTSEELSKTEMCIRKLGIATQEARGIMSLFIQSEMKVTDAAKLSRAAQDLAVNAQMDSSAAAQTLTYAISAQSIIMLRQFGLVTNQDTVYSNYARTLKKVGSELTDTERKQAFLNEILSFASRSAGTYEAAMEDVGKQFKSLRRYQDDAAISIGQIFLPVMKVLVKTMTEWYKWLQNIGVGTKTVISTILIFVATISTLIGAGLTLGMLLKAWKYAVDALGISIKKKTLATAVDTTVTAASIPVVRQMTFAVLGLDVAMAPLTLTVLAVAGAIAVLTSAWLAYQNLYKSGDDALKIGEGFKKQTDELKKLSQEMDASLGVTSDLTKRQEILTAAHDKAAKILKSDLIPAFTSAKEATEYFINTLQTKEMSQLAAETDGLKAKLQAYGTTTEEIAKKEGEMDAAHLRYAIRLRQVTIRTEELSAAKKAALELATREDEAQQLFDGTTQKSLVTQQQIVALHKSTIDGYVIVAQKIQAAAQAYKDEQKEIAERNKKTAEGATKTEDLAKKLADLEKKVKENRSAWGDLGAILTDLDAILRLRLQNAIADVKAQISDLWTIVSYYVGEVKKWIVEHVKLIPQLQQIALILGLMRFAVKKGSTELEEYRKALEKAGKGAQGVGDGSKALVEGLDAVSAAAKKTAEETAKLAQAKKDAVLGTIEPKAAALYVGALLQEQAALRALGGDLDAQSKKLLEVGQAYQQATGIMQTRGTSLEDSIGLIRATMKSLKDDFKQGKGITIEMAQALEAVAQQAKKLHVALPPDIVALRNLAQSQQHGIDVSNSMESAYRSLYSEFEMMGKGADNTTVKFNRLMEIMKRHGITATSSAKDLWMFGSALEALAKTGDVTQEQMLVLQDLLGRMGKGEWAGTEDRIHDLAGAMADMTGQLTSEKMSQFAQWAAATKVMSDRAHALGQNVRYTDEFLAQNTTLIKEAIQYWPKLLPPALLAAFKQYEARLKSIAKAEMDRDSQMQAHLTLMAMETAAIDQRGETDAKWAKLGRSNVQQQIRDAQVNADAQVVAAQKGKNAAIVAWAGQSLAFQAATAGMLKSTLDFYDRQAVLAKVTANIQIMEAAGVRESVIKNYADMQRVLDEEIIALEKWIAVLVTLGTVNKDVLTGLLAKLDALKKKQKETVDEGVKKQIEGAIATKKWTDAVDELANTLASLGDQFGGTTGKVLTDISGITAKLSAAAKIGSGGIAHDLLTKGSSTTDKFIAGIKSAGAIVSGIKSVWDATGQSANKATRAISGVLAGAKAGAAFGPWGAAIGGALGLAVGLFRKSPTWAKATTDMAKEFGAKISRELADSIAKMAKDKFRGDLKASESFNLSKVMDENAVSTANFTKYLKGMHDQFSMLSRGQFSPAQFWEAYRASFARMADYVIGRGEDLATAMKDNIDVMLDFVKQGKLTTVEVGNFIDENWAKFAANLQKDTDLASSALLQLIKQTKELGIQSKEIQAFLLKMGSLIGSSMTSVITGFAGSFNTAWDTLSAGSPRLRDITERLVELQKEMAKPMKATEYAKLLQEWNSLQEEGKKLQKEMQNAGKVIANTGKEAQTSFDRMGRMAQASMDTMIANGMSYSEALAAIGPGLDNLIKMQERLGLTASDAFKNLLHQREWITMNSELADSMSGLNQYIVAMANSGAITAQSFTDMGAEAARQFAAATASGLSADEAIKMMQPSLQTIWELQKRYGYAVDESTQKLLDQAVEAGAVGEEHMSAAERTVAAMEKVAATLDAIAAKMGVQLPAAADAFAQAAVNAGRTAYDAMDEVENGHSPGGIAGVIAALATAGTAFGTFASTAVSKAAEVMTSVDGVITRTQGAGDEATEAALQMQAAMEEWAKTGESTGVSLSDMMQEIMDKSTGITDSIKIVGDKLKEVFVRKAQTSTDETNTATGTVKEGVIDVADELKDSKAAWDKWADDAVAAARRAFDAIQTVIHGHSPGGLDGVIDTLPDVSAAFTAVANTVAATWAGTGSGSILENVQELTDRMADLADQLAESFMSSTQLQYHQLEDQRQAAIKEFTAWAQERGALAEYITEGIAKINALYNRKTVLLTAEINESTKKATDTLQDTINRVVKVTAGVGKPGSKMPFVSTVSSREVSPLLQTFGMSAAQLAVMGNQPQALGPITLILQADGKQLTKVVYNNLPALLENHGIIK